MNLSQISNIVKYNKCKFVKGLVPDNVYETTLKYPNVEVINIFYKSDGLIIHGFIFKKKYLRKNIPTIIYCRGGNNGKIKLDELKKRSFYNMPELIDLVANG